MELLTGIFTAFGLSASAGLNAYIPLLLVGLIARYTDTGQRGGPPLRRAGAFGFRADNTDFNLDDFTHYLSVDEVMGDLDSLEIIGDGGANSIRVTRNGAEEPAVSYSRQGMSDTMKFTIDTRKQP